MSDESLPENRTSGLKRIAIVGGGLVGSLNACYFAKKGYNVDVYEGREDIRTAEKAVGRSINLALSHRGRAALRAVGLEEHVTSEGIPMPARMIHDLDESTHSVPYGTQPDHYIISIDRRRLNEVMLSLAESQNNVTLHFHHKLTRCNLESGKMQFRAPTGEISEKYADLIIGCDGAYSAVRDAMMKQPGFNYQQEYIEHGYIELVTPPTSTGQYAMPPNYLHIWPRTTFMLIALPNLDKSFTTTLFMPFANFAQLTSDVAILSFFRTTFPDALKIIGEENLVQAFMNTKPSSLISIKCNPYHFGRAIIMGDAAHAMVPFYGQGMNAGFLDCLRFHEMFEEFQGDTRKILPEFTRRMTPGSHVIIDLAMYNYIEMRYLVNTRKFRIRKKIDNFLYRLMPKHWIPLYTMVTFTMTPYEECAKWKEWQEKVLRCMKWTSGALVVIGVAYAFVPRPTVKDYLDGFKEALKEYYASIKVPSFRVSHEDVHWMS